MLWKSISTVLFLVLAVTFILPMLHVVKDAEAAATHYRKLAAYHEIRTHADEFCDVVFVGWKTLKTIKHPAHEGSVVNYFTAHRVVLVDECDDDDDDGGDGGSETST